jgi:uncharacterized iron-regulated membrane protein
MKASRLAQKIHKWLGLLIGLQLVIWSISGFYMVVVDIDIIHGDHLVNQAGERPLASVERLSNALHKAARSNPQAHTIELKSGRERPVLQVNSENGSHILDALSGKPISYSDQTVVHQQAEHFYAGKGKIQRSELIVSEPPREIGARTLPLWRVDFDDIWGTTLYISPQTGELATRRHTLWRVFDFLWMLHIMDYDERENINNSLLRIVSFLAFTMVLSGVWYLYYRLNIRSWLKRKTI